MKLSYSAEAVADLRRLREFIAEHDPHAAARVGAELLARLEHIRDFPRMGRPVSLAPEPRSIRDVVFGNYVVRYLVHNDAVVVLRIWHHFEDRGLPTV